MMACYDCNWDDQTQSFKKTLIILRTVSQRELTIVAGKFDFSNKSFYEVRLNNTITSYKDFKFLKFGMTR